MHKKTIRLHFFAYFDPGCNRIWFYDGKSMLEFSRKKSISSACWIVIVGMTIKVDTYRRKLSGESKRAF